MLNTWKIFAIIAFGMSASGCSVQSKTAGLTNLERAIRSNEYGNIHSVLAADKNTTRIEWYFTGADQRAGVPIGTVDFDATSLHDVRSLTKSIVSLLFGIALSEGVIEDIDDPISKYLSDYSDLFTTEIRKIRLRHILSMTSGLGWDERTYPYGDPRNSETALDQASDRIRFVLSLPVEIPPGKRFLYSSGDVDLLAQIIARSTGVPLDTYAREKLFSPLGIDELEWAKYESGGVIASWGLRLRPRDMLKIGRLVLQSGAWEGKQVVPASWIRELLKPRVSVDTRRGIRYGYYWWFGQLGEGKDTVKIMQAVGNGGQRITLVPERALVIVTTAGFYTADDSNADRVIRELYSVIRVEETRREE